MRGRLGRRRQDKNAAAGINWWSLRNRRDSRTQDFDFKRPKVPGSTGKKALRWCALLVAHSSPCNDRGDAPKAGGLRVMPDEPVEPPKDSGKVSLKRANFAGATFTEETNFDGVTFTGTANFNGATFAEGVSFEERPSPGRADSRARPSTRRQDSKARLSPGGPTSRARLSGGPPLETGPTSGTRPSPRGPTSKARPLSGPASGV